MGEDSDRQNHFPAVYFNSRAFRLAIAYTFCVVSKRFRKNYIHRFTATRSLFWWSPWSPVRRACVYLSTNQFFDYIVMATILFNCVFLAMSETIEEAE
ncbi:unnamed protein product [Plutella xylostella]|uniref:(diamondback moth) hypothetical protein n=1 Tax=Plutella xylostella TaxID=51655 RepID=A0A8S4G385_PLUXY|nr:unnamed protein product [Plutella xylostella]